jgi:hypothetical protein
MFVVSNGTYEEEDPQVARVMEIQAMADRAAANVAA